jgi:hypothetical protein
MIFLAFALHIEAQPYITKFNLKKVHNINNIRIYKNENIAAVITGTGVINAAAGLSGLFANYYENKDDIFINIGLAGGSKENKIGEVFIINKIMGINYDEYYPDISGHPFKESSLRTILRKDINKIETKEGLLDLEVEGYYNVAQNYVYQNNIHIIKILSDYNDTRHLNIEKIKNILKDTSEEVIEYIKVLDNIKCNHRPDFTEKEIKLIDKIVGNFMLSNYLKIDFKKKALDYKIRENDLVKLLEDFSDVKVFDKKNRRTKYDELCKKLEIFKK